MNRNVVSKEFAIAEGDTSGTVNAYNILVVLLNLHDKSCFIPFL